MIGGQNSRMTTDSDRTYISVRLARWRELTDFPLMVLALASLPMLLLEADRDSLQHSDQLVVDVVNLIVLIAFVVDYVVELSLASRRRAFVRHEWSSLLIVVTQAVALLPGLGAFGVMRAMRATRVFRFLAIAARAAAVAGSAAQGGRELLRKHAAGLGLGLAGMTWITSAAAFTISEGGEGRAHSFADSLWWSATTITTVGYGDVYPVTPVGRLIGGFTMVVGISTFALVTAKIAQFLIRND